MFKVLFVCTGNICRSPTADGVMKHIVAEHNLTDEIFIDSAGTHGYHEDCPPDARAVETAKRHNIDMSGLKARRLCVDDFLDFDLILAMDLGHLEFMQQLQPPASTSKIKMFLEYAKNTDETDVPDPYYGAGDGFQYVFDLIQNGCDGLLEEIKTKHIGI